MTATSQAPAVEKPSAASAVSVTRPRQIAAASSAETIPTTDAVWQPRVDEATATLMIPVVRGLLLDRLATGDRARTDAALARFADRV